MAHIPLSNTEMGDGGGGGMDIDGSRESFSGRKKSKDFGGFFGGEGFGVSGFAWGVFFYGMINADADADGGQGGKVGRQQRLGS